MIDIKLNRQKRLPRNVNTRYAPSPTGDHHVGGARTALVAWVTAQATSGRFTVRIEDTDRNRFVPGASDQISETLHWLIDAHWNTVWQSHRQRQNVYSTWAIEAMDGGRVPLYFCSMKAEWHQRIKEWATSDNQGDITPIADIVEHFVILAERNTPFIQFLGQEYETATTEEEVMVALKNGAKNHRYSMPWIPNGFKPLAHDPSDAVVRFGLDHKRVDWYEPAGGGRYFSVNAATLTDPVLLKSDGWPTYHLAAMLDDVRREGTDLIIRGEEWLPSAPIHIQLLQYMQSGIHTAAPQFVHLGVILAPDGNGKLSKRKAAEYNMPVLVKDLQQLGYHPIAVGRWLLETVLPQEIADTWDGYRLNTNWDLADLSVTPSQLSLQRLNWLQKQLLSAHVTNAYESILTAEVRQDIIDSEMVVKNIDLLWTFLASRCITREDVIKMVRYLHEYRPRRWITAQVDRNLLKELKGCRSRIAMIAAIEGYVARASNQERKECLYGLRELISGQSISPDIYTMVKTMRWSELKRRIKK